MAQPQQWVVVEVEPAPRAAPKAVEPKPIATTVRRKRVVPDETKPEEPAQAAESTPAQPVASDLPRAASSQPISLFPSLSLAPGTSSRETEPSHGETVHPDDPRFSPDVVRAETEFRVKKRVTTWAEDGLAEARAQRGLPHPYFSGVGDAARAALDRGAREHGITATSTQFMKSIGKRYADAASSYASTGDPNLGPPGINPRPSEQISARFGNGPEAMGMRMLAQATETQNDLSHGKPLIGLTLELRQFRDGAPLIAVVVQASEDSKFDAFVLETWPKAVAEAGAPPPDAFHGPELRSIWAVEGWLGLPKKLETALSYLPVPGVGGIGIDKVLPAMTQEGYHYEFRARLLRVYQ